MEQVIDGKIYDTDRAEAIADDEFSDGSNRLTRGRGRTLYKTKKGSFFVHIETCWQGEHDHLEPLVLEEAKELFESLVNHSVTWKSAFNEEPEEA